MRRHGSTEVAAILTEAGKCLAEAGIDDPFLEAETLLGHMLGINRAGVIARFRDKLDEAAVEAFCGLVKRRAAREPLQYITGKQEFFGLDFRVGPSVLIPRPETEYLAQEAVGFLALSGREKPLAADIGTGSGCIAVAIAAKVTGATIFAVDASDTALAAARENAAANGAGDRIKFLKGDLLSPLGEEGLAGRLDLVASNPPYIPSGDIPGLQAEVLFEPHSALDGGLDGLDAIRRLIGEAPEYLRPGGLLLVEIGFGQADAVKSLVSENSGLVFDKFIIDFSGIERVLRARKA